MKKHTGRYKLGIISLSISTSLITLIFLWFWITPHSINSRNSIFGLYSRQNYEPINPSIYAQKPQKLPSNPIPHLVAAQGSTPWIKSYNGKGPDNGYSVTECNDGGFAITGSQNEGDFIGEGGPDMWLIRTDANGNHLWNHTYGGTTNDVGKSVIELTDGNLLVAGYTYSFGAGDLDAWLVCTDANGNYLWNHTYGGTEPDFIYAVVECGSGGYAITGGTYSFGAGSSDVWLVRTSSIGQPLWSHTYGGTNSDTGYSLVECSDGGFAIIGQTASFGVSRADVWLIRTDAEGNKLWEQMYGGIGIDQGNSIIECSSGGFAIACSTNSYGSGERDFWLIRTRNDGTLLWDKTFGGPYTDDCWDVVECNDGGFIFAGEHTSYSQIDAWLVRTDANGTMLWDRRIGEPLSSYRALAIAKVSNGGFAITGSCGPYIGFSPTDVFLAWIPDTPPPTILPIWLIPVSIGIAITTIIAVAFYLVHRQRQMKKAKSSPKSEK